MTQAITDKYENYCNSPWGVFRRETILQRLLPEVIKKDSFLDIGCGTGSVTNCLCRQFRLGVAIDNSKEMLKSVDTQGFDNLRLVNDDFNSFSFEGLYDLILCHNVLEYQPKSVYDFFLDKVFSLLKDKNSVFSLVVINREVEVANLLIEGFLDRAMDLHLNGNYWSNTFKRTIYLPTVSEIWDSLNRNGFVVKSEHGIGLMKQRDYDTLDDLELKKRIGIEHVIQNTSRFNNSILIHFICQKKVS